jgi:hypothetical protein
MCSPACILSLFITATLQGELRAIWDWSDNPEQDKKVEGKKEI